MANSQGNKDDAAYAELLWRMNVLAQQRIDEVPLTETLIDQMPDSEWHRTDTDDWNIEAGK